MKRKLSTISIFLILAITFSMLTGMVSSSSYSDEHYETLNDCFADNKIDK